MTAAAGGAGAPFALEAVGICKRFGPVLANDDVSMAVERGSIHGVVGENGAGKSTLMRIVQGYYRADAGEIGIDGERVRIANTQQAIALGVGMVHQHFMLVDSFTVVENMALGAEGGFRAAHGLAQARQALAALARDHDGLEADPDALVGDLPVGVRQRVEILKALYRGARILILDEPTGALTPAEADDLFGILRALRARGRTVVLITHKLREIMALCDRVTVMRAGRVVGHAEVADTTADRLAETMVGRAVPPGARGRASRPGRPLLEVERLTVRDRNGVARVRDVSFSVRAGEIVGVAGVAGNGQSELLEAVAGTLPVASGAVRIDGEAAPREGGAAGAAAARGMGLAHVPEDRQRAGLVGEFDASENAVLGRHRERRYNRGPLMRRQAVIEDARRLMERFDVRPLLPLLAAARFSGGNQQKIVVGREIARAPAVLLAGQPTRGVDIGAAAFIHSRLTALRDAGAAILLVSVELDEILSLSDRILTMFEGEIVGETAADESDARVIGAAMAGAAARPPGA